MSSTVNAGRTEGSSSPAGLRINNPLNRATSGKAFTTVLGTFVLPGRGDGDFFEPLIIAQAVGDTLEDKDNPMYKVPFVDYINDEDIVFVKEYPKDFTVGKKYNLDTENNAVKIPVRNATKFYDFTRIGLSRQDWPLQIAAILRHLQQVKNGLLVNGDLITPDSRLKFMPRLVNDATGEATIQRCATHLCWLDLDDIDPEALVGFPPDEKFRNPDYLASIMRAVLSRGVYGEYLRDATIVLGVSSSHGLMIDGKRKVKLRGAVMLDRPLTPAQKKLLFLGCGLDTSTFNAGHQIYSRVQITKDGFPGFKDPYARLRGWVSPALNGHDDMIAVPEVIAAMSDEEAAALVKAAAEAAEIDIPVDGAGPKSARTRTTRRVTVTHKPSTVPRGPFAEALERLTVNHNIHASIYALACRAFEENPFGVDATEALVNRELKRRLFELADEDPSHRSRLNERIADIPRQVAAARAAVAKAIEDSLPAPTVPDLSLDDARQRMAAVFEAAVAQAGVQVAAWRHHDVVRGLGADWANALQLAKYFERIGDVPTFALFAPAGVGKSEAYLRALSQAVAADADFRAAIVVPTHALAGELADRGAAMGLDIGVYRGMGDACQIWNGDGGLVKSWIAAKAAKPCDACSYRAECPFVAQDMTRHQVVIICGNEALTQIVPEAVRRPEREKTIAPMVHAAAGADEDRNIELFDHDRALNRRRGDFDLVIADETNFPGWLKRPDNGDWFALTDLAGWAAAGLPVPAGEVLTETQVKAHQVVQAFLGSVVAALNDRLSNGADWTVGMPGRHELATVSRACLNGYIKPPPALAEIVTSKSYGNDAVKREAARRVRELERFNQLLDKIADLAKSVDKGAWEPRKMNADRNRLQAAGARGEPDAIRFNYRSEVHRDWQATGATVLCDATGVELLVRQWWPAAEVHDLKVLDHTKHYYIDHGPTYGAFDHDGGRVNVASRIANFGRYRGSRRVDGRPIQIGAVMPKALASVDEVKEVYGEHLGWFGGIRGVDRFSHVDELHVFGRLYMGPEELRWRAAVLFGLDMLDIDGDITLAPARVMVATETGIELQMRRAYRHRNPAVQALIEATVFAEIVQAAGRARGIQRLGEDVRVYLATVTHVPSLIYQPETFDMKNFEDAGDGSARLDWTLLQLAMAGRRFPTRVSIADELGVDRDAFGDAVNRATIEGQPMPAWIDSHLIERRSLAGYIAEALLNGCSLDKGVASRRLKAAVCELMAEDGELPPSSAAWESAIRRARGS